MKYEMIGNDTVLTDVKCFDLDLCTDCGQAFRWKKTQEGTQKAVVRNIVGEILQKDGVTVFKNTDRKTFETIWLPYFDLDRDYEMILSGFDDEYLKAAIKSRLFTKKASFFTNLIAIMRKKLYNKYNEDL